MKTIALHSRVTAKDLLSIMGSMDQGNCLFITNSQTARNALNCVNRWTDGRFEATLVS